MTNIRYASPVLQQDCTSKVLEHLKDTSSLMIFKNRVKLYLLNQDWRYLYWLQITSTFSHKLFLMKFGYIAWPAYSMKRNLSHNMDLFCCFASDFFKVNHSTIKETKRNFISILLYYLKICILQNVVEDK